MLKNITATQKGFVTGFLMIAFTLILFYTHQPYNSPQQYFIYVLYTGGIIWSLFTFSRSEDNPNKFAKYFLEGFKCFVIVTLLMVLFTFIFNKLHPEFKEELAVAYKTELVKQGNSTPAEIESSVLKMKDYYLTMLISRSIFAYLFLGGVITAIASLVFIRRK
jgi:hypothetical protein